MEDGLDSCSISLKNRPVCNSKQFRIRPIHLVLDYTDKVAFEEAP